MTIPHTAMILAAGLGTRMRPLTNETAKPLIEVAGKRLMDRQIEPLIEAGVKRLVVNTHWCADQVEAHSRGIGGVEVVFSDEREEVLETGGAISKAASLLGDDPIFVVNTDAFWAPGDSAPLKALADAYDPANADEILLLADRERCLGFPARATSTSPMTASSPIAAMTLQRPGPMQACASQNPPFMPTTRQSLSPPSASGLACLRKSACRACRSTDSGCMSVIRNPSRMPRCG